METLLTFDRMMHPFGDMRGTRWLLFGVMFVLWALYPLLYARAYRRAESEALQGASVTGGRAKQKVRIGFSWLLLGLAGLTILSAMVVIPYDYPDLEWKVLNPFSSRGPDRLVTFLAVIPAIVVLTLLQYWAIRKPLPQPARLVLAGTRALVLWIIFIMLCGPYVTDTRYAERPYRSVVLLDDSLSMGETVREFAVASGVRIADSVRSQLANSSDPKDAELLRELMKAADADNAAARNLGAEIMKLGLAPREVVETELADVELVDFEMRQFVRELVKVRAERLRAKIAAIHGQAIDLAAWRERESELATLRSALRNKQDELAAEQQQESPSAARLSLLQGEAADLETRLTGKLVEYRDVLDNGVLAKALKTRAVAAAGDDAKLFSDGQRRVVDAVRSAVRNLLSTLDEHGPTRWDIASELIQPGNPLTVQDASGLRLIDLALAPSSGQLSLLDLLRRNRKSQNDRLPEDIAKLADKAGVRIDAKYLAPAGEEGLRDPLTVYTFSQADPTRGSSGLLRQVTPEDLDFMRPEGKTTQVYGAYLSALKGQGPGDLASVLILSDGHDTGKNRNTEGREARELAQALQAMEDGPVVITVAVGHPRPERVLALPSVGGDEEVILDEMVSLDLRIRSNANWKDVEVVLCEDNPNNEIPYEALNGKKGVTKADVPGGEGGGFRSTTFKLYFKPKTGGRHKYWIKLNRRRLPGEDTYDNNVVQHEINVIDRKIRVLYIDQSFRWEARYLIEAMVRDKALEVHTFIFDADDGWPQKASEYSPKARMEMPALRHPFSRVVNAGKPNSYTARASNKDEWFATNYDVVILGDVDRTLLSSDNRTWLAEWVTQKRGGIIFLAGKKHNPVSYVDPDLEPLLPVKAGSPAEYDSPDTTVQRHVSLTLTGRGHEIARFSADPVRQEELWGKLSSNGVYTRGQLDGYYWYSRTRGVKDEASTVIAQVARHGEPVSRGGAQADPLLVTREIGTGRSLFVGTDELWRLRRFYGDFYHYRFWQNAIRWAATSKLMAKKEGIDLHTDEKRYLLDQPVTVYCDLLAGSDQYREIAKRQEAQLREMVAQAALPSDPSSQRKKLLVRWRNASAAQLGDHMTGVSDGLIVLEETSDNHFEKVMYPNTMGKYELSVLNEPATTKNPALFFVEQSSEQQEEVKETEVNSDLLKSLSSSEAVVAGGSDGDGATRPRFHRFFEASKFNPDLRTRTVEAGQSEREAFSLMELMLVIVSLLGAEWFIRKLVRLS